MIPRLHATWRGVALLAGALASLVGADSADAQLAGPPPTLGAIEGSVVDATTGVIVPSVHVRLPALRREDDTHENGAFHFSALPPGRYELIARRIGYEPQTRSVEVRAGETTRLRIALATSALQLAATVTTGTLRERRSEEMLSPTTVLTEAELDRRRDATIATTLRHTPGIAVTSIGPATARPVIRGLSGDRLLVLEDGQRTGDLSNSSADHAVAVEGATAHQLEVVRGPMALLYGSNALGGVINVVREEVPNALPDHAHGTATAQATSAMPGGNVAGFVALPFRGVAVRAEGAFRQMGDMRTPVGRLVNTGSRSLTAAAGASLIRHWGYAGLSYRYFDSEYGIPGGFVGGHPSGVDIAMARHALRSETEVRRRLGPFSSLKTTASFTHYGHQELEASGEVGTRFVQDMLALETVARHDHAGALTQGAVGLRGQFRDFETGGSLKTPSTRDVALAAFWVEEVGEGRLRAQLGARYDWARYTPQEAAAIFVNGGYVPVRERTFGSLSGSAGVLFHAGRGVRFGASASRAFRTPDFNELYSNGPHLAGNSYDVGDPDLGPETGIGVDLFARLTRDRAKGELAVFHNALSGYVYPRNTGELGAQGGRPRFQYTGENARLSGAEGNVELSLLRALVFEATGSYVRGTVAQRRAALSDSAPSRYLPFIPPLNGLVGLRYDVRRWFAGVESRMAARQDRLGDFETETEGYAVLGLSGGLRWLAGGRFQTITLRVDNATNREYRDHLSRIKSIQPEMGRNISLLYRVSF